SRCRIGVASSFDGRTQRADTARDAWWLFVQLETAGEIASTRRPPGRALERLRAFGWQPP
ncbi:MAG: hypothetical protein ACLPSW_28090, partial [Roseiarcus sp.]